MHAKRIEQSVVANDHSDGLIWRQIVREARLANLGWIIRPLIAIGDKVRHRHPFDDESILSAGLASGDIDPDV